MMPTRELAEFISKCRAAKEVIDAFPSDIRPTSERDAVRAGLAQIDDSPTGWKLGGTNLHTRNVFGVSRAYFGPLKQREILRGGAEELSLAELIVPKVEPEICVVFGSDLSPDADARDVRGLQGKIDHVSLGLEVPDTILSNPAEAGVFSLVADRCAAGRLVVGEPLAPEWLPQLEAQEVVMVTGQDEESIGHGNWLIGGALAGIRETLLTLQGIVEVIPAGCIFATGGLARACVLQLGQTHMKIGPHSLRLHTIS